MKLVFVVNTHKHISGILHLNNNQLIRGILNTMLVMVQNLRGSPHNCYKLNFTNDPKSSEYSHLTDGQFDLFYNHFSSYDFPCFWIKDLRYRLIAINPNNCTSNKPYHLYLWRYGFKSNLTLSYM